MTALYDLEHPYYCDVESPYGHDLTVQDFDEWEEFLDEWGNADFNYNLVFRFDWIKAESGASIGDPEETDRLLIFFMIQRKGLFVPVTIRNMKREQEPEVRAWLAPRWEHLRSLWTPFSGVKEEIAE